MAQSTGPGNPTSGTTPSFLSLPVANGQTIYQYRPVAVNTSNGNAYPVTASANLRFIGWAQLTVTGTASNTPNVNYTPAGQEPNNRYFWINWTGTLPQPGNDVYWVDDQTVATVGANNVLAGVVVQLNGAGQALVDTLPAVAKS